MPTTAHASYVSRLQRSNSHFCFCVVFLHRRRRALGCRDPHAHRDVCHVKSRMHARRMPRTTQRAGVGCAPKRVEHNEFLHDRVHEQSSLVQCSCISDRPRGGRNPCVWYVNFRVTMMDGQLRMVVCHDTAICLVCVPLCDCVSDLCRDIVSGHGMT